MTSIAAPGVAAIGAFRTLPRLGLELPEYAAYADEKTEVMGRIAAGQVMHPIFGATAISTTVLAFVLLLAWIAVQASGVTSWRRVSARMANVAIVLLCSLSVGSLLCAGGLDHSLDQYLAHARAGERAQAEAAREVFDGDHRTAERLAQVQLVVVLVAIGFAATAIVPRREGRR